MAKVKIELKANSPSSLTKFVKWYEKEYSTISATKRVMKGKVNDFFVKVLEVAVEGKKDTSIDEKFKLFASLKDKSPEEIDAEIAFKNDPDGLKEWKRLNEKIKASKKKS